MTPLIFYQSRLNFCLSGEISPNLVTLIVQDVRKDTKWTTLSDRFKGSQLHRVANSLLSQELNLCFSETKFTKAPYTKNKVGFS